MLGMAKHGERDLVCFLVPICNPCLSCVSCDPCVRFVCMLDISMHWGHFLASSVGFPLQVVVPVQHCCLRNRRMLSSDVSCDVVVQWRKQLLQSWMRTPKSTLLPRVSCSVLCRFQPELRVDDFLDNVDHSNSQQTVHCCTISRLLLGLASWSLDLLIQLRTCQLSSSLFLDAWPPFSNHLSGRDLNREDSRSEILFLRPAETRRLLIQVLLMESRWRDSSAMWHGSLSC